MGKEIVLEIALQDGAVAEIKGDRVIVTIDTEKTKRDLWEAQMDFWLTKKDDSKTLASGYLRVIKNKLKLINFKK